IGHAGEGGLYAELVQDRSFDALAAATGFHASPDPRLPLDLPMLAATHRAPDVPVPPPTWDSGASFSSKGDYLKAQQDRLGAGHDPRCSRSGIVNFGYWGVYVQEKESYTISIYARAHEASLHGRADFDRFTVSLVSEDLDEVYASTSFDKLIGDWHEFSGDLAPNKTDTNARLAVTFEGSGSLVIDMVSLFPTENVEKGKGLMNPWPFRQDLLDALKALKPAFLRFPGGCYIEGDWMRNAFMWKDSVGPNEARPGHMNGVWGYWSTDGLGLFEYMLMVEELKTEPVWVINNGVAHGDSIAPPNVWPLVQDALDSLEFIMGPPDSKWGKLRADMGREEPWELTYMAIGNEASPALLAAALSLPALLGARRARRVVLPLPDCGKPYYLENYLIFFGALRAAYPHLRLISNCHMGGNAPTDTWDWHIYTNPQDMFNKRHEFDNSRPEKDAYIFASEYAVTDGGGWGNVIGAVSEAAFMTGLERNGEVVTLAAYVHEDKVAASATCQSPACDRIALKIVNFSSMRQVVKVALHGKAADTVAEEGQIETLHSDEPEAENSFDEPNKVAPSSSTVNGLSSKFTLKLEAWSVNILQVRLGDEPSLARSGAASARREGSVRLAVS
ncbi:Alpha-L-arabinofuranosidase 1, partial [Micractinium conductrix]